MTLMLEHREIKKGIFFALLATLLWSGNFIVARGVIHQVPPITLAFCRWAAATILLCPIAWKKIKADWILLRRHFSYLLGTALSGIAIFNTLVYVAGHHTPAINLALIGTSSAPVFSLLLAAIFLKEKISGARLIGMLVCFIGILLLISKGSWLTLRNFRFAPGDIWALCGAFSFAVYTIQVRRKPSALQSLSFLWAIFALGTLMLLPPFIWERVHMKPIQWTPALSAVILYLGLGASVTAFLIWNLAIARLGAGRTALFGNLIPLFSTIEAVLILDEPVRGIHLLSGTVILTGLVIANKKAARLSPATSAKPEQHKQKQLN